MPYKINWEEEIVQPYNEKYGTNFKSGGELVADMRYSQKLVWRKVGKILGVTRESALAVLARSKFYIPEKKICREGLKKQLLAIPSEELAVMTIAEIRKKIPGFRLRSYYAQLQENSLKYKRRRICL